MLKIVPGLALLVVMSSGCALMDTPQATEQNYSALEIFPSPYSSDADFLNLASDDALMRKQAQRNVYVYYNCLSQLDTNYNRQDPMVLFRSQYTGFSEIPRKIYQHRLDRLADLTKQQNKADIQAIVDKEINELNRIPWNTIQEVVNAIVTGARKIDLNRVSCPVSDAEIRQQTQLFDSQRRKLDMAKKDSIPPTIFLPPFM